MRHLGAVASKQVVDATTVPAAVAAVPAPKPSVPTTAHPRPAAETAPETPAAPSDADATPDGLTRDSFIEAVAGTSRRVAAMLRSCQIDIDGTTITVTHAPALARPLAAQTAVLHAAAATFSATVTTTS